MSKSGWFGSRRSGPLLVAALWAATALVQIADQLVFPPEDYVSAQVSSILHLSGGVLLASLVASAILGVRGAAWQLATAVMSANLIAAVVWFGAQFFIEQGSVSTWAVPLVIDAGFAVIIVRSVWLGFRSVATPGRRIAAIGVLLVVASLPSLMNTLDGSFRALRAVVEFRSPDASDVDQTPYIDPEALWGAQPALIDQALERVGRARPDRAQTYVVTVAAQGSQALFAREAGVAARVLANRFAARDRTLTLSNGADDLSKRPLATNTNLRSLLQGLATRIDRKRDLVVIYLAAHGGREAYLSTDLPDYTELDSVSAASLRAALDAAGIERRVVIVSACFAGSWIKPLATDNSIVVTAAAADRTSFGCSDDRKLTYFGEAFLEGPLGSGVSLATAFEATRATVARWEARDHLTPSKPQASVGRNMQSVWTVAAPPAAAK
jgi:hypothetical protein